ncbi:MAG: hypothetical protein HQM12_20090 [SAR324 cluster bacterium]|nr:hypothetical protein [SAR324 cluster bacterium]
MNQRPTGANPRHRQPEPAQPDCPAGQIRKKEEKKEKKRKKTTFPQHGWRRFVKGGRQAMYERSEALDKVAPVLSFKVVFLF